VYTQFPSISDIGEHHKTEANIRKDFCHKTSRKILDNPQHKIIVLEDFRTKNMTTKPKAKKTATGRWNKNGAHSKAGLNQPIVDNNGLKLKAIKRNLYEKNK